MVGVFTALIAALIALTQDDIRSTCLFHGEPVGLYVCRHWCHGIFLCMFHVNNHAFFKALLFLGAGSVIHAMGGEQNMRHLAG